MSKTMLTNSLIQSGRSGGDTMPRKPRSLTLGHGVSVRELGPDKFELRTRKPRDNRRVLYCSWTEARAEAAKTVELVKGELAGQRIDSPTISRALAEAITNSRGNAETLSRYTRDANRFMEWLKEAHSGVAYWNELRPSHLKQYLQHLEHRGLARDSIRQALLPMQKASRFWVQEFPRQFDPIAQGLKLPAPVAPQVITLSYSELTTVLNWLLERYPAIYAIASMAGLSGMRLREAMGILNRDVDFSGQTIRIQSNHLRKLKNETFSPRVIPLTRQALEAITVYRDTVKVQTLSPDEPVFLDSAGQPWTAYRLGNECRNAVKVLKATKLVPAAFSIRRLRSTFNTLCHLAGAREAYLQRYIGQTPTTINRRHYLEVTAEDLRREVTAPFERLGQNPGQNDSQAQENEQSGSV